MSELQFEEFMRVVSGVYGYLSATIIVFSFLAGMFFNSLLESFLNVLFNGVAWIFKKIKERASKDVD